MDYERISAYLHSLESDDIPFIDDIESYAVARQIPIARRETVSFLQTMVKVSKPATILEVGTAVGYSTLKMAMASGGSSKITSIERSEENYGLAKANVSAAESEGIIPGGEIELLFGDATDILKSLEGPYDFIFMDAAKGQYILWLPEVMRLLAPGGVLISDNVFQDETIFESKFTVERRERTIHKRMREYLYALKHDDRLDTSILPLGDGVALSYRRLTDD